jgi:hypothetical protein
VLRWNTWTRLQPVQFEWEDEPQPRAVRLVSDAARVDDPIRVTVAGVEVEGRIEAVESSTLRVRRASAVLALVRLVDVAAQPPEADNQKQGGQKEMTPAEIAAVLLANQGRRVRVTYIDGVVESVDVHSVDDEGCLHSGPDGIEPAGWWTRFDSISDVQPDEQQITIRVVPDTCQSVPTYRN